MIVHPLKMCTSYFVKLFHFFSVLMGVELRHFPICPQHFRGAKFVKSVTPKFSFLFIQTLPNDFSLIEDVHLLYCAHFIICFLTFDGC